MSTLDNFRKEAKQWLKACRGGDAAARARLAAAHPNASTPATLRDVQHALAIEHGFESWIALKAAIAARARTGRDDALTSLFRAAEMGDAAAIEAILDARPELVSQRGPLDDHSGLRTALHFGIRHEPAVAALVRRGADPNVRDDGDNAMPLHFAAENNDLPIIKLLIEHGADPNGEGDGHELAVLGWATCFGRADPEVVSYLLAHGSVHNVFSAVAVGATDEIRRVVAARPDDLNRPMDRTNQRRTPLHLAVIKRQPASLMTLLALGADTERVDAAGLTALDQAALDGQQAMVDALLESGARIALPAAVALERADDVERLLREDPDCLRAGHRWQHLLVRAAGTSSARTVEALIRYGADVNVRDSATTSIDSTNGYTALHAAAWQANAAAVAVLLAHGADPTIREDKWGSAAAGWADYAGHDAVRDLILDGPIDLFQAIDYGRSDRIPDIVARDPASLTRPFRHYAPSARAEPDEAVQPDMTPLEWARARKNTDAARILEELTRQRR